MNNDLQVVLFVGNGSQEPLATLFPSFAQDALITAIQAERLGTNKFEMITPVIEQSLPDLVCLLIDDLEAAGDAPLEFCSYLKSQGARQAPVIVVYSARADENRRIEYLVKGADDILTGDMSVDELRVRLLVHLRRNIELHSHAVTRLPGLNVTAKALQRRINRQEPWALMVLDVDHLDVYTEVYGYLPSNQVLKTLAAMIQQVLMVSDLISQTEENTYVILTQPEKAEKMAAILCRQFENASPNFYSEKDRKQGYMVSVLSDQISRRVPLLSISMGIVSSQAHPYDNFVGAFNAALQMKTLAKATPGCGWISDRPRLAGAQADGPVPDRKRSVLVLESDAALAYLLKTTLTMEGYDVHLASGPEDAQSFLSEDNRMDLVILDSLLNGEETGLAFCRQVREKFGEQIFIICTSTLHDRQKVLSAGADLYLPKPFELLTLFSWTARLLQGQ